MTELKINVPSIDLNNIVLDEPIDTQSPTDTGLDTDIKDVKVDDINNVDDNKDVETDDSLSDDFNELELATETLAELGYFEGKPEDLDEENFDIKEFVKLVKYNMDLQKSEIDKAKQESSEETFKRMVSKMSPLTQQLFELELQGSTPESTIDLAKTILYSQDIKSLSLENSLDQEKIVREYYKATGETTSEIEDRIKDLVDSGLLKKEATRVKPKLDAKSEEIAKEKAAQQELLYKQEVENKKILEQKAVSILDKGDLDGIPLDQESASFLYNALMQDEVPVIIKGKQVEVSIAEAMVLYHKYHKDGDVKHLMKALLYLHDPQRFEEHYVKQITTRESERIVKENRMASASKTGKFLEKKNKETNTITNGFLNTARRS